MRTSALLLLLLLLAPATPAALADEVMLQTGGRIVGTVETLDDGSYRVTTVAGTQMHLERRQVSSVTQSSAEQQAYALRSPSAPDTAEAQLALAKWCRQHNLGDEASRHAERVVELDPTNAEARQMLNFRNVDGEWMTREQVMAGRGLVWSDGKYRTQQEIAIRAREEKLKDQRVYWRGEIRKWLRGLDDRRPEKRQEAFANFNQVQDPMAGPYVVDALEDANDPAVRRLLAQAAARIDHQATVNALVQLSLNDPDEDLRLSSLDWLVRSGRPGLADAYVKALRSNDNVIVNRAAMALEKLGDQSTVGPLIDALVTKHKRVSGGSGGGDTYSFSPTSGGFSMGGGGPKEISGQVRNPDVLTALVQLTNEHFGYDEALWKKWHATQAQLVQVDLRRDN